MPAQQVRRPVPVVREQEVLHGMLFPAGPPVQERPGLLLGDEPTSQLDHDARDMVLEALAEVSADLGTTVVVAR